MGDQDSCDEVNMSISNQGLLNLLFDDNHKYDDTNRSLNIPANIKRCGMESKLIVTSGANKNTPI